MKNIDDLDNLKEKEIIKGKLGSKEWNLIFIGVSGRGNECYVFCGMNENKKAILYHCYKNNIDKISDGKIVQEDFRNGEDFIFISETEKMYKESIKILETTQ